MKLPISLLLLAVLGEAVKLTTEKSRSSTHTSKRELREGIFGERTELLKKYVPTTPGNGYSTDDFKPTLQGPSSTEQIFGSRLPPVSKISDLLSRPSPSFELALANHLYSPVSAYAVKLPTFEEKEKSATKGFFSKHKNFKHLKHLQEESYEAQKLPTKGDTSHNPELFSYINSDFRTGPASPPYPFGPAFSGLSPSFAATPNPQKSQLFEQQIPFGFRLKTPGHNGPLQYYHPQSPVPHGQADFDFEYENQKDKERDHSKGKKQYETYNQASRHELERQHPIPLEVYNAHPNGAISYSSFTNQAYLAAQPESQLVYKYSKLQEPPIASDLRQQQQFYVPQLYQSEKQKLPSPVTQQQYYNPAQAQPYFNPLQQPILLYPVDQSGKSPSPQFIPIQQPQLYLSPNRQQLLQDLQQKAALQSLNLQQSPVIYNPEPTAAQPESLGQSSTHAPLAYQQLPENTPVRYSDQPAAQNSIDASSVRIFTPTPSAPVSTGSPLSVQPLQPHTTATAVEQVEITPKSHYAHDQVVKPTTVQPQTIRDPSQQPSHLYQDNNALQDPQQTIQAQHSSPETLQPLHINQPEQYSSTTAQPEILIGAHQSHTQQTQHHTVQAQQLNLGQIHSNLDSASVEPSQQPNGAENSQPTEATPQQYQNTTPQPTAPSTTDYEIEIASHVDHSQLPKDLRPVTTQENTQSQGHVQLHKGQAFRAPNQYLLRDGKAGIPDEALPPQGHLNHLTQNVPSFDPNGSPYSRPFLGPVQPLIQPRVFAGGQPYLVPAGVQQSQGLYPPVQYFDRFPGSAYRVF